MVTGDPKAAQHPDPHARIKRSYNNNITDEFVPFTCVDAAGNPIGLIAKATSSSTSTTAPTASARSPASSPATAASTADGGIDLPKAAELDDEIPLTPSPPNLHYVCMTQYDKKFTLPMVIPPESMDNLLANVMA
jgi:2,3-bisphosphoglycerate-independent phosphoglycerate mutase